MSVNPSCEYKLYNKSLQLFTRWSFLFIFYCCSKRKSLRSRALCYNKNKEIIGDCELHLTDMKLRQTATCVTSVRFETRKSVCSMSDYHYNPQMM